MRLSLRRLASAGGLASLALALLCTAVAPARTAIGYAASSAPLGGVSVGGLDYGSTAAQANQEVALARQLHAKVVRIVVPWSVMEAREPGQLEPSALAYTDRLVADAATAGIRVIIMVDSTPCWASSAPASLLRQCTPEQSSAANAWPPSEPSAFAAFVAALTERYGTQLEAIEIWNEPDQANELYFAGPEKAARYAAMLRAAYPAIKKANPGVLVLGGSIVGDNGKFLRQLYAEGIKGYYDGLAVHFYTLSIAALRYTHEVQVANGDSTPLWLDEFGFSSCWPRQKLQQDQACVTPRLQAADLADVFHSLARVPYVAGVVVYKLQSSTNEEFGVLTATGAHKPAFATLAKLLVSPFGSPSPVTLLLRRKGHHVLASGAGPAGNYMELEALRGTVPRYRALFVLNRFNDYSIALPSVLGTSGLTVRVFQYGQSVARATRRSI
jgi:polysaccharide biosynthesis protein PslG